MLCCYTMTQLHWIFFTDLQDHRSLTFLAYFSQHKQLLSPQWWPFQRNHVKLLKKKKKKKRQPMHIPRNAPLTLLSTVVCHWPLSLSRLLTSSNLFWLVYFVFVYSVPVNQWQVFNVCYSMMSNWAVWTPAPCSCFGKKKMSQLSNVWASMGNPLNVSRACRHSSYYPFVILFWHLFVKTD